MDDVKLSQKSCVEWLEGFGERVIQDREEVIDLFIAKLEEIAELKAEIESLKINARRYMFIRSTCVNDEGVAGYDKAVDEHMRKRNENLN